MGQDEESWDRALSRHRGDGSLVGIARQGRLVREGKCGPLHVELTRIDECALALVDLALRREKSITFVYPAPAGEVSVLLAAQILLHEFLRRDRLPSVGLLTADTTGASRTWEELRIAAPGSRTRLSEAFPCFRCGPDGAAPFGKRPFRGLLVGQRSVRWPVDVVVVDHLTGPVYGEPAAPTVHVFADPLDPTIGLLESRHALIWGWTPSDRRRSDGEREAGMVGCGTPFSVAHDRSTTIARGVRTTIHVVHNRDAQRYVGRLRDDLRVLADSTGPTPPVPIVKGLRVAWHHLSTLMSLPCRPSEFDRFAGVPPIAARATRSFEPEIAAWARTLVGDAQEIASVIAGDLGDLRAALEDENPFFPTLVEAVGEDIDTLVVVKSRTAARGLVAALMGDPNNDRVGRARVCSLGRLHREGTRERAIVVGLPARWEWHRLDSGLSPDVHALVLGMSDAYKGREALVALRAARQRWGAAEARTRVWEGLVGGDPPAYPGVDVETPMQVSIVATEEARPEADPFAPFESILVSSPLLVGDAGVEESVAEETTDGRWVAVVDAVEVETDAGVMVLPSQRIVDVREGARIVDRRAEDLEPDTYLLVGRRAGRTGLLEALADRLKDHRPDLFASSLLIDDFQASVRGAFGASGMTKMDLYERLVALGFRKTYQAAGGYVERDGPLAPRDFEDLRRLDGALGLGLSDRRAREIFAGVQRRRAFRRAAGKALSAAARGSTISSEMTRVDPETGLSLADLREVVLEAKVLRVRRCPDLVPLSEVGRLEPKDRREG